MNHKERIDALKSKFQARITAESTPEEIQAVNDIIAELDALENDHNEVVTENGKYKDAIARMVITQGDGKKPRDESSGSKPKTIEECIAEVQQDKGEK